MPGLTIGSAEAKPGEIVYGWLDAVDLPTGGSDRFPVIIAQGRHISRPVFWITASIHGGEHTGVIVAQRLATRQLVEHLRGTLIIIPTLNPAGLRTKDRSPYYHNGDPNRLFPDPQHENNQKDKLFPPPTLESAYRIVFQTIKDSQPVALLDLHSAQIGSLPMAFRDPVFYQRGRQKGFTRSDAQTLQAQVGDMLDALGFTIINEFAASSYVEKHLHRSVSGSVLNGLNIPAATIELGSWMYVDDGIVDACLAGLRNVLRWANMLDGPFEPVTGIPVIRPGYPVRRCIHPHAPQAGIVHHLVRTGDAVQVGQPLARLTDIFGEPIGDDDGLLRSAYNGFVIGWQHGVVRYQGEPIMVLAIKDTGDMTVANPY
jgi:predicted deacylase